MWHYVNRRRRAQGETSRTARNSIHRDPDVLPLRKNLQDENASLSNDQTQADA